MFGRPLLMHAKEPGVIRLPHSRGLLALAALLALTTACTGYKSQTRYDITQQATLPAPAGPDVVGRMPAPGNFSLQGGVRVTHSRLASDPRDRAELGHDYLNQTFHGRASYGAGERMEVGLMGQYGHARFTQASSDVRPEPDQSAEEVEHLFWGGAHARVLAAGNYLNGVAAFGELTAGEVPFTRHVDQTTTYSTEGGFVDVQQTTQTEYTETTSRVHAMARAGVQGFYSPIPWLTFNAGGMAQRYPRYWARRVTGRVCEDDFLDGKPVSCSGDTPNTIRSHNNIIFGTAFAGFSAGMEELPVSLHFQAFYHALAPAVIRHTSPYGGDLQLRVEF